MELYMWVHNVSSSASGTDVVESQLVVLDGTSTYWNDDMVPCRGYSKAELAKVCTATNSTFVFIGHL